MHRPNTYHFIIYKWISRFQKKVVGTFTTVKVEENYILGYTEVNDRQNIYLK